MRIYYAVVLLLLPAIMLCCGYSWRRNGPKKINSVFGYRTALSMKSAEAWHFAHRYVGSLWRRCSVWLALLDVLFLLISWKQGVDAMGITALVIIAIQMAVLLASVPITERALKKNYDEYGRRKTED